MGRTACLVCLVSTDSGHRKNTLEEQALVVSYNWVFNLCNGVTDTLLLPHFRADLQILNKPKNAWDPNLFGLVK